MSSVRTVIFFDKVDASVDKATVRALSKFGAFVRRRSKSSLRYATKNRKVSFPGKPPVVHRAGQFTRESKVKGKVVRRPSSPLRELIYFAYAKQTKSVVIGPAVFSNRKGGGGHVPRVLEEGGVSTVSRKVRAPSTGRRATPKQAKTFKRHLAEGRIVLPEQPVETRSVRVVRRPYMRPAYQAELPKAAEQFRGEVK
jgi:hypothetical protein